MGGDESEQSTATGSPGKTRQIARWLRRRPFKTLGLVLLVAFLLLNALAYRHAGAMTTFRESGASTAGPEALSFFQRASALVLGVSLRRPSNSRTPADLGFAFSTHELDADGTRLEAWLIPHEESRGVVVLCHGHGASKSSLLSVAQEFHGFGYSCVLLDFRGGGGSDGNETSLGYHESKDVAAAVAFAKRTASPDQPVILFGTSMGAAAALRAVHVDGVEPSGLILEAPFNSLIDTVRNRFDLMGVPSFPSAELLVFWGGVRAGIDGFDHNPADYASSVTCPTLILHGDQDQRVSVPEVRAVFEALPNRGLRTLKLFEGVGHESFVKARREEWVRAVSEFLVSTD